MTKGINSAPFWLDPDQPELFPQVELALTDPDGLLAVGGDLSIARLCAAYQHGIFPWYSQGQPILWWSPHERAILFFEHLNISRSMAKVLRNTDYNVTFDTAFSQVIQACAQTRKDGFGTWIVPDMQQAYMRMHEHGFAHSVEVWRDQQLIGGLYGVSFGSAFFGESMFSRENNASKIAFIYLSKQLSLWDFGFIDCQVYSAHLGTLGVEVIAREQFIQLLKRQLRNKNRTGIWKMDFKLLRAMFNE